MWLRAAAAFAALLMVAGGVAAFNAWDVDRRGLDMHGHGGPTHEAHHEPAPWLALVDFGGSAGNGHGHGDHASSYVPRPSIVGLLPYDGPTDAEGIRGLCAADDLVPCTTGALKDLLAAKGSETAFATLEELARLDAAIENADHPIAHDLGRFALEAYGTIEATLADCSYKVFQGCLHGALQAYFEAVPPEGSVLRRLCAEGSSFQKYACNHGVGHGVTLAYRYDLSASLAACQELQTGAARGDCEGGVFMENAVAYIQSHRGDAHGHDLANVTFWADPARLAYPCDVVADYAKGSCWRRQSTLILHHNGNDYFGAAAVCSEDAGPHDQECFGGLGRDVSAYTHRDVERGSQACGYAPSAALRAECIESFIKTIVLNYADPTPGLPYCVAFAAPDKAACYRGLAETGRRMLDGEAMAELCAGVEEGHAKDCRDGAGLN